MSATDDRRALYTLHLDGEAVSTVLENDLEDMKTWARKLRANGRNVRISRSFFVLKSWDDAQWNDAEAQDA